MADSIITQIANRLQRSFATGERCKFPMLTSRDLGRVFALLGD